MKYSKRYFVQLSGLTILALLLFTACTNAGVIAPTSTPTSMPTATATTIVISTPTATIPSAGPVTISIDSPDAIDKSTGRYFHVLVKITAVSNFGIAQYDISYDPAVIKVQDVTFGTINDTIIRIDDWGFVPANTQGTVRIINIVPKASSASGEGYLADIYFKVFGDPDDFSALSFVDGTGDPPCYLAIANPEGTEIPAVWINGSVIIE